MVLQCLKVTCQAPFMIVMQVKSYVMNQVSLVVIGVTDPFKGPMKSAGLKPLKFDVSMYHGNIVKYLPSSMSVCFCLNKGGGEVLNLAACSSLPSSEQRPWEMEGSKVFLKPYNSL